ncbi:MAG: rhodanese-like domain-containing protein, partial [Myxococcota bacterium]|nr:rhodanese-like domain-containing protein [Myxococcota bacterium]
ESLIDYQQFCGLGGAPEPEAFTRIGLQEASQRLDDGWKPFVLDVRKEHEATIVSFDFVDQRQEHGRVDEIAEQLPRDRDILIHCKMGGRSAKACAALAALGFTRLYNLEGGIVGWAKEIDPKLATY